ncbi:MAG: hypothetical protein FJX80_12655 [Bacteroidetes bacterium]|nr:hypothetical protein [Bacteroidota bacterium]
MILKMKEFLSYFLKTPIFFASLFVLVGCKADIVEVNITAQDLKTALEGTNVAVPFKATFSQLGEMNDETRAQLNAIKDITISNMNIDEFNIDSDDQKILISIEGNLPISKSAETADPYVILVGKSEILPDFISVQIVNGQKFNSLKAAISGISMMASPQENQPIKFKVKAPGSRIIAPAAEIDGITKLLHDVNVKNKLIMSFKDGPYEKTGGGFFIQIQ